ncbi:hypothetical protein LOK49_LG05G03171 [Camellia lanceoleosa]|uniref:Uncharacterized protein n=1 Tax=Camellia lanceoleosa TaxID=1840588 RepID=A0ACC0HJU6_9ERIC|nr:hypothetical protein LOK49_LG05G03171 [Camellia lanceoleosa]
MRQAFVLDEDVNLQEIGKLFEQYCCVSGNINSSFMYLIVCTACRTDCYSGSTIASLVTRAYSYVVVQARERGLVKLVQKDVKVTMNHFLYAIEYIKSRLQESSLEPCR